MTPPRATYRLQFRGDVDFARAAALTPYLARLGVSHLYASPLFQATPGSTHGYDVTDFDRLDAALGGDDRFAELSAALRDNGLGLILDIVPNHMAASCHNPWWADVLRNGKASRFAEHFDIDWSQPRLLLPILGQPYGAALAAGEFSLGRDADGLTWQASGQALPLDPLTWALVLNGSESLGPPAEPGSFRTWLGESDHARRLDAHLAAVSSDKGHMHRIHEAQNWRLAYWRAARDMLGYRRFFEISDLVGVRVEEPRVFDDVHRFVFSLIDAGHIGGLRVDHVDGLADPGGYLHRLARQVPRPVPIWVEKILEREERLPADWPIAGATGYEFLATTAAALTDGAADAMLDRAYAAYRGSPADYAAMRDDAKREILTRNLAAELERLVGLLRRAFADDPVERDRGPDTLGRAIVALLVALPVYRTYFSDDGRAPGDQDLIAGAVETARADPALDDPAVVAAVAGCLRRPMIPAAQEFRTRFQQVSGALMAKAVEDTLFYRFNRLISANEVGADPSRMAVDMPELHAFAVDRAGAQPMALNATATHDTKRGEDARMRIAAIAEAPERWSVCVARFEAALADAGLPDIGADTRWLFYQALLGSWESSLSDDLPKRIGAFLLKAAREAKLRTSWVKADPAYEQHLEQFVERALSHAAFVKAFDDGARAFVEIGARKSLVQLALKLTLPGIPDIYQGTEAADLSLVDPDNRRTVDFDRLAVRLALVEEGEAADFDGKKMALLAFGLALRHTHADVFAGAYLPISVEAAPDRRIFAFAREGHAATLIVAADLSGGSATTNPDVSLKLPQDRTFGALIAAFPAVEPREVNAPDRVLAADLDPLGLSIRLFAG